MTAVNALFVTAIAAGGRDTPTRLPRTTRRTSSTSARENGLYIRRDTGGIALNAVYPGTANVIGIAVNPHDWTNAFFADSTHVCATTDGGATAGNWSDITGNLMALGIREITSITFVPGAEPARPRCWSGPTPGSSPWRPTTSGFWRPFGTTLPQTYALRT